YVPAGGAPLLSTALMGVVPARLAGVEEIVVVTPPPAHPSVVLAATVAGAHRILQLGGAQAVAAVAYGTETVQPVDVVAGPGNLFVQLAKREVVGVVGIDTLAGPTEVVVLADGSAPARWVAADLLAQAEHAPDAAAILVTDDGRLAQAVEEELQRQLQALPRREVARESLERWGACVLCADLGRQGVDLVNELAPEHVEIMAADALTLAGRVTRAGAVFVGPYTPEALGDYAAGTNHILPTNGAARFASAVGVHTFLRHTSLLVAGPQALRRLSGVVMDMARAEGLEAHARSVALRLQEMDGQPAGPQGSPAPEGPEEMPV
ncbi:MAG TPA: histidinol dehydrogenase, partial [Limnochordales bacterium]